MYEASWRTVTPSPCKELTRRIVYLSTKSCLVKVTGYHRSINTFFFMFEGGGKVRRTLILLSVFRSDPRCINWTYCSLKITTSAILNSSTMATLGIIAR